MNVQALLLLGAVVIIKVAESTTMISTGDELQQTIDDFIAAGAGGGGQQTLPVTLLAGSTLSLTTPIVVAGHVNLEINSTSDGSAAIIDGAGATRMFELSSGANLRLTGLTLQGGHHNHTGAVASLDSEAGNFSATNCKITESGVWTTHNSTPAQGGLIHVSADAGGAYASGVEFDACAIVNNTVTNPTTVIGGLVFVANGRSVVFNDCTIRDNVITAAGGELRGGFVHASLLEADSGDDGNVLYTSCVIDGNQISGGGGLLGGFTLLSTPTNDEGGGNNVLYTACTIRDNEISSDDSVIGGVVCLEGEEVGNENVDFTDCVIRDNSVTSLGGGISGGLAYTDDGGSVTFSNCGVHGNTFTSAESLRGALVFLQGSEDAVFEVCELSGNTVRNSLTGDELEGCFIYLSESVNAIFTDCGIVGNTISSTNGEINGGVVHVHDGESAVFTDCRLHSNSIASSHDVNGGCAFLMGTALFTFASSTVRDTNISSTGGWGAVVYIIGEDNENFLGYVGIDDSSFFIAETGGGTSSALFVGVPNFAVALTSSIFNGGGIASSDAVATNNNGTALWFAGAKLEVNNCTYVGHTGFSIMHLSDDFGGSPRHKIRVLNSKFASNGGAVALLDERLSDEIAVVNTDIDDSTAGPDALLVDDCDVAAEDGTYGVLCPASANCTVEGVGVLQCTCGLGTTGDDPIAGCITSAMVVVTETYFSLAMTKPTIDHAAMFIMNRGEEGLRWQIDAVVDDAAAGNNVDFDPPNGTVGSFDFNIVTFSVNSSALGEGDDYSEEFILATNDWRTDGQQAMAITVGYRIFVEVDPARSTVEIDAGQESPLPANSNVEFVVEPYDLMGMRVESFTGQDVEATIALVDGETLVCDVGFVQATATFVGECQLPGSVGGILPLNIVVEDKHVSGSPFPLQVDCVEGRISSSSTASADYCECKSADAYFDLNEGGCVTCPNGWVRGDGTVANAINGVDVCETGDADPLAAIVAPCVTVVATIAVLWFVRRKFARALERKALLALEMEVFWISSGLVGEIADIWTDGLSWGAVVLTKNDDNSSDLSEGFVLFYSIVFWLAVVFSLANAVSRLMSMREIWASESGGTAKESTAGASSVLPAESTRAKLDHQSTVAKIADNAKTDLARTKRKLKRTEMGLALTVVEDGVLLALNMYILSRYFGSEALNSSELETAKVLAISIAIGLVSFGFKTSKTKELLSLSGRAKHLQREAERARVAAGDEGQKAAPHPGNSGHKLHVGVVGGALKAEAALLLQQLQHIPEEARPMIIDLKDKIKERDDEIKTLKRRLELSREG